MYAIIRTGGKQYKVQAGDVLQVEKLAQDLGAEVKISEVLMLGGDTAQIGQPLVKNASVTVVITKQSKLRKQIVFKKKRRQGYRRFKTHRQEFSEIFIKAITSPDGQVFKADSEPNVIDVVAMRAQRIVEKQEARKARVSAQVGASSAESETVEAAPKKTAKKKVAKKAAGKKVAKKGAAKKGGAKKKAAKKTSKKA